MGFNEQISVNIKKLNNTDKKILDYILKNSAKMTVLKLKDIANSLYISPNAVVRFAKRVGYSGFSEMKYDIVHASDLRYAQTYEQHTIHDLSKKIMSGLQKTLDINRDEYLESAIDLLDESNKIIFFALGLSRNTAKSFIQRIEILNKVCILSNDRDNALTLAKNIDNSFIALFVSLSGNTKSLIKCANYLKEKDVKILSLTGLEQNYIQEISDIALYAHIDSLTIDNTDAGSRLYLELILEIIITKLYEISGKI